MEFFRFLEDEAATSSPALERALVELRTEALGLQALIRRCIADERRRAEAAREDGSAADGDGRTGISRASTR